GFGEGGYGEGGASAGSDAEDYIFLIGLAAGHFVASGLGIVFANFGGGGQGLVASGDDEMDAVGVEGGKDFDGVEGGDASAGTGADVDEASAAAEGGGDLIDGAGDLRQGAGYGEGD